MPVVPGPEQLLLRNQNPFTARVDTYLAVAPYGAPTFTARVDQVGWVGQRGEMAIDYDGDAGELGVLPGMTLWVGSTAGGNERGAVRIRSINLATKTLNVAENDHIAVTDNDYLSCPGSTGFHELWSKFPRLDDAGTAPIFYKDYDILYSDPLDDVLPPKANGGPPAVAWIVPATGLATVNFTDDRSATTEAGAAIASYDWRFPGAWPGAIPAGPLLWLDAGTITGAVDYDTIQTWFDQSGNGLDATQGVVADRATYRTNLANFRPGMWFDNVSDYYSMPNNFQNFLAGVTIFIAVRPVSMDNDDCWIGLSNGASNDNVMLIQRAAGQLRYQVYDGAAQTGLTAPGAIIDDEFQVFSVVQQGGVGGAPSGVVLYRNGANVAAGNVDVPNNVLRTLNYIARSAWGNICAGFIAEVIIYNRALNAGERAQVDAYMRRKYLSEWSASAATCAAPLAIQYDTPGFYYARLEVTDDTAEDRTNVVYVPVWIFEAGVEEPYSLLDVRSQAGSVDDPWNLAVRVYQTDTAAEDIIYRFIDGALVVLFTDTWYGTTHENVGGFCHRENIRFVGWLDVETLSFNYAAGTVEFEATASDGVMKWLPGFADTLEDHDNPSEWYEVNGLTLDRAMHAQLERHTTVNQVCHVELAGEGVARPIIIQRFSKTSIYNQLQDDLLIDAQCLVRCDRQGIIRATRDPQFMSLADRGGVPIVIDLGVGDWMNNIDETRPSLPAIGWVKIGGFAFDLPLLSQAPGVAPLQQTMEMYHEGHIFVDQTEANLWSGLHLTKANNNYPDVPLVMAGYWPVFDPAFQEYVRLTTTPPTPVARNVWTNQVFVVRGVEFDDRDGTCVTTLDLEIENPILIGETLEIPVLDTESPPTIYPAPPPPTWGGDLTHVILRTTQGIIFTDCFDEPIPVWQAANTGLLTGQRQDIRDMSFDYDQGSRLYMLVTDDTVGGAFRCNDLWRKETWTQQFTSLSARVMVPAGDPCVVGDPNWGTYPGLWAAVWCDPVDGRVFLVGGAHVGPLGGCDSHKISYWSDDSLAAVNPGDGLWHDPFIDCGNSHCATPFVGNITSSEGWALYSYVCAWGVGGDSHRGYSTDGGDIVDTSAGQIVGWTAQPLWHCRAAAEAMFWLSRGGVLDIWKSGDHGVTWGLVGGGGTLPGVVIDSINGLAMHTLDTGNLMMVDTLNNLYMSTDGGITWSAAFTGVGNPRVVIPVMVGGFPEGQAFITAGELPVTGQWVYLTTDLGTMWANKTGNLEMWLEPGVDSILQIIAVQAGMVS